MDHNVIIVAGGKGLRMGGELPKQFIPIAGKPILMHTILAFYKYDSSIKIILVLPKSHQKYWSELCNKYSFDIPHQTTDGGDTRFHSVKNGLAHIHNGLVAIHDGARPFVSKKLIEICFEKAQTLHAVIPVLDSTDSLRECIDENHSKIIDRSKIKLVQTPQVFTYDILTKAYGVEHISTFTDDASVVEYSGINIHLTQGEESNIKITTPFDLEVAKIIKSE